MTRDECILLGKIVKTHGVKGGLIIRTENLSFEVKENLESVFIEIDGILVPFFIAGFQEIKTSGLLMFLDDYLEKDRASRLVGYPVWIPAEMAHEVEEAFSPDLLKGFELIVSGTDRRGVVTGFVDIPGNPLLEIFLEGKEILIPFHEDMIIEFDQQEKILVFDLPEGL